MGVLVDARRIDPADVTIRAAVNQIDAAVSSVTKNDHLNPRHIELHHRLADRQALQGGGRFGNDDRVPFRYLLLAVVHRRGDDVARRVDGGTLARPALAAVERRGLVMLEPALVTAQALLDP